MRVKATTPSVPILSYYFFILWHFRSFYNTYKWIFTLNKCKLYANALLFISTTWVGIGKRRIKNDKNKKKYIRIQKKLLLLTPFWTNQKFSQREKISCSLLKNWRRYWEWKMPKPTRVGIGKRKDIGIFVLLFPLSVSSFMKWFHFIMKLRELYLYNLWK